MVLTFLDIMLFITTKDLLKSGISSIKLSSFCNKKDLLIKEEFEISLYL